MKLVFLLLVNLGFAMITSAGVTVDSFHAFAKAETSTTLHTIKNPDTRTIKVALLLDTSNSMDGPINQARAQLWELVNELAEARCGNDIQPDLKIALHEYGNDRLNAREGYIRMVNSFSSDPVSYTHLTLPTNREV